MLNLSLIRHGKSNWNVVDTDDLSRKISKIGESKTNILGNFLQKEKIYFDEVFCSPAKRTKQTLEIINQYTPFKPKIQFIDDLYHASGKDIFDTVMICATKKKVLVVSHEPLLSMSIENFFKGSNNKNFLNAIEKFNTSAFFNVSFECKNWYEIQGSKSFINFFVRPNDINF
jgi:phosphohistidine phosphatase